MRKRMISCMIAAITIVSALLSGCDVSVTTGPEEKKSPEPKTRKEDELGFGLSGVEDHVYEIESRSFPLYVNSTDEEDGPGIELAFMDGAGQVPYITVSNAVDLLETVIGKLYPEYDPKEYKLTVTTDKDSAVLTRPSHYYAEFDFDDNTIYFLDFDAFIRLSEKEPLMNTISSSGYDDDGNPFLFQISDSSFERYGEPVTFRPGDYGIDLVAQDGEYYIPLQLFSDIFMSQYKLNTLFNEEAAFVIGGGNIDAVSEKYFVENAPTKRSKELAAFNYKELCFALDALYGLKEQHNIKSFDLLFKQTGLVEPLLSTDPQEVGQAISDLTLKYFDDGHSVYAGSRSYMMKKEPDMNVGPSLLQTMKDTNRYLEARKKLYPDGPTPYEEIGNTAYITFDEFSAPGDDYYEEPAEDHLDDTIALMIYAYGQITRENSPIENVVLDLSNNGGGASTAAAFVIGAFIGDGSICMMDPLTDALCCENYKVDVNLDRKFDEKDSLLDYHLFCITSPSSFSCGNLVPSVLKNSHMVTILGQVSGGGTCVVHNLTTADGCAFSISGIKRLAYTKNGSFYDIDRGVEPDHEISNIDLLYDRKYMTEYINNLMGK